MGINILMDGNKNLKKKSNDLSFLEKTDVWSFSNPLHAIDVR
jgi:hypothetical protein